MSISACTGGNSSAPVANPDSAILTWDPVTTGIVSGYKVYYGEGEGKYLQPVGQGIDVGNVTAFVVSGLGRGKRYFFAVAAYNSTGLESGLSNEVFKDVP